MCDNYRVLYCHDFSQLRQYGRRELMPSIQGLLDHAWNFLELFFFFIPPKMCYYYIIPYIFLLYSKIVMTAVAQLVHYEVNE